MQIFVLSKENKMLHVYDGNRAREIMIIGDFKNEGSRVLKSMAEDGDVIITTDERNRFYEVNFSYHKEDDNGENEGCTDRKAGILGRKVEHSI